MSSEQASEYLGLTRAAFYKAVERGQIQVHHWGSRLRFRKAELDELMAPGRPPRKNPAHQEAHQAARRPPPATPVSPPQADRVGSRTVSAVAEGEPR